MVLRLGELLVKTTRISSEQLDRALRMQKERGGKLGKILVNLGFVSEEDILEALSRQFDIPIADLDASEVDEQLLQIIPVAMVRRYNVVPLQKKATPSTLLFPILPTSFIVKDLSLFTGYKIKPFLASEVDIAKAIDKVDQGAVITFNLNGEISLRDSQPGCFIAIDTHCAKMNEVDI